MISRDKPARPTLSSHRTAMVLSPARTRVRRQSPRLLPPVPEPREFIWTWTRPVTPKARIADQVAGQKHWRGRGERQFRPTQRPLNLVATNARAQALRRHRRATRRPSRWAECGYSLLSTGRIAKWKLSFLQRARLWRLDLVDCSNSGPQRRSKRTQSFASAAILPPFPLPTGADARVPGSGYRTGRPLVASSTISSVISS